MAKSEDKPKTSSPDSLVKSTRKSDVELTELTEHDLDKIAGGKEATITVRKAGKGQQE